MLVRFIVFIAFVVLSCEGGSEDSFKNMDFSGQCSESKTGLCDWQVSYEVGTAIMPFEENGQNGLLIDNENGVGFVEQLFLPQRSLEESILAFSAVIKTENVLGKGAGLNVAIYNATDELIQNADMGYGHLGYAKGNSSWKTYEVKAVIAPEAAKIKIGLINYGSGKAYFKEAKADFIPLARRTPSKLAHSYISAVLDTIRKRSLYKDSVDFKSLKIKGLKISGDAKTPEDNYLAVRYLLGSLGDHHSFLMTAAERKLWEKDGAGNLEDLKVSSSKAIGGFGYISVPGFHGDDPQRKKTFVDSLQQQLRSLYHQNIKGWIVDLRQNDGGNMQPMLAGLEPLFSQDTLGYLFDVNGRAEAWGRGEAFKKEEAEEYLEIGNPFRPDRALPIAVLYNGNTGSSGEIVILSFVDNANTQSFGQPSWGLTTGNGDFKLPDGAYMFLASTQMADRNKKIYQGAIIPEVLVEEKDILNAALNWLKSKT